MLLKKVLQNKMAIIGSFFITVNVVIGAVAPWIAPHDPFKINVLAQAIPPSDEYLFGTDEYGRDILSRIIFGARISLAISFLSVSFAALLGVILGALAGYYKGLIDTLTMRLMDALMSFPAILLAIGVMAVLHGSILNVTIALGIVYTPRFARILRGSVLSVREKEFVEASRAMGNNDFTILFRHILPNCLAPLIVQITACLAYAILAEAALSFLGLGAPPPAPSWGNILSDARNFMMQNPYMTIFPGLAVTQAVLGFNIFGDALRDILDPRLK